MENDDQQVLPGFPVPKPPPESAPFQEHSETSREAAERIEPVAGTERARVLGCLRAHTRLTDEQMQMSLRMNPSTQRPRRVELVNAGLARDSGEKGVTSSGRRATLWEAIR